MPHTLGPWHADENGDGTHCITAGRGADIADTRSSDDEEANARLIAAAPDLLEACQAVLAGFRYERGRPVMPEWQAKAILAAAIDKATTET